MTVDAYGLPLTGSVAGAAAFDYAVAGYLGYRADLPKRLEALTTVAPDMPMAHTLKGCLGMLSFKQAAMPAIKQAWVQADQHSPHATARERAHNAALARWINGDVDGTLGAWEQIMAEYPRDLLAFRLHHFTAFWSGEPDRMAKSVDATLPAFGDTEPATAALLACKAFAYEELHQYGIAEKAGREALRRTPGDVWAAHAVAHVLEMQGRHDDGIALLDSLEPHWRGANSLLHHLWWHRGLYHFERGEFATVLDLYDRQFRNLTAPLTAATPDLYIDVQNATSMLFRLERQGVEVGARWQELADKAEARIGDCLSAFTLPHWMMALTATGRFDAAGRMLDAMHVFGAGAGSLALLVKNYAIPVCAAILARARGNPAEALVLMRPALNGMERLGGSHAQQDVLHQLYLDCADKAGAAADARRVIDHVDRLYTVPAAQRRGYMRG